VEEQKKKQEEAAKVTIGDQLKAKFKEEEEKAAEYEETPSEDQLAEVNPTDPKAECASTDEPIEGTCP